MNGISGVEYTIEPLDDGEFRGACGVAFYNNKMLMRIEVSSLYSGESGVMSSETGIEYAKSMLNELLATLTMKKNNEFLYSDEYVSAYMVDGVPHVYSDYFIQNPDRVLIHGADVPEDYTGFEGRWHYTPYGDYIIGGYAGDGAFMPTYLYKDGVFEKVIEEGIVHDIRFSDNYLYLVLERWSPGELWWDAREHSNLLQLNLADLSTRYLGVLNFVYGWSEDKVPSRSGSGYMNDPDKMEWEVREDGVYIFGFWQNPDFSGGGESERKESGFYLVDAEGNGHRLAG